MRTGYGQGTSSALGPHGPVAGRGISGTPGACSFPGRHFMMVHRDALRKAVTVSESPEGRAVHGVPHPQFPLGQVMEAGHTSSPLPAGSAAIPLLLCAGAT